MNAGSSEDCKIGESPMIRCKPKGETPKVTQIVKYRKSASRGRSTNCCMAWKGSNPKCTVKRREPEWMFRCKSIDSNRQPLVWPRLCKRCNAGNPCQRKIQWTNRKKGRTVDDERNVSNHFARKSVLQQNFSGNQKLNVFITMLAA